MNIKVRASHVIVAVVAALALIAGVGAAGAVAGAKWVDGHDIKPNSIPANRLEKGSVGSKQVKKGAIKSDRIAAGAVTQRQMAADSVTQQQLADDSVTTDALTDETVADLQPTVSYVEHAFTLTSDEGIYGKQVAAACPAGTQAVGGYVKSGGAGARADATGSYVDPTQNAYVLRLRTSEPEIPVVVQTICLR